MRPATAAILSAVVMVPLQAGCSQTLMPTPVVYLDERVDPFDILPEDDKDTSVSIFYATDRRARDEPADRRYVNGRGPALRLGEATVRFGPDDFTWEELRSASTTARREREVSLHLVNASEHGVLRDTADPAKVDGDPWLSDPSGERAFAEAINRQLARSRHKDVNIYVHGAKVGFAHTACVAAELFHFLARDGVMLLYAYPTQQTVLFYPADISQSRRSAPNLAKLLNFLAQETAAEEINLLSYSAGSLMASLALVELREKHADKDDVQLQVDQRIGDVIFAASDVDFRTFSEDHVHRFYDLPRNVEVLIGEDDGILAFASLLYGASRLGRPKQNDLTEEELAELQELVKIDAFDVGYEEGARGGGRFSGHGYWYKNSWVSTSVLAALRYDVPPDERGLAPIPESRMWFFPADYPQRIVEKVLDAESAAGR